MSSYEDRLPKYEMNDAKFNSSLYGYLIYSMYHADFSSSDIVRMMRIIDQNGFDMMTVPQAEEYFKKYQENKLKLDKIATKNRILERED